jgi:hypothetical protein
LENFFLLHQSSILVQDILSDNFLNRAQDNTVVPAQIIMDRVEFEPTTSAAISSFFLDLVNYFI